MKILQVVWNFPDTVMRPFNMYYFYWPMQEALQRGWQAEVLTFQVNDSQPAEEIIDGIRVRRCPAGVRKGQPFSWPFISALLTTDADIVYCHGYGEGRSELAILLSRLRGRKVIFAPYFHAYPYRRPVRELYDKTLGRFFFNLSDRVVVFTDYTASLLRKLGVDRKRLQVIPLTSRPEVFAEKAGERDAGCLLRAAGVSGNPLILGVGQLIERKGWEHTVRCLPAIIACFPQTRLLIIGSSRPAEPLFRARLEQLATDLGVIDSIQILQDNPPEFIRDAYRSASILTHPSSVESFGLVLLEAMAAGVPVVAHNGTGIPCIIDDGVTGYVVDVCDTQAYSRALLSLLNDPALCQRMGNEGRRQAVTRFGQAEVAAQLFTMFADALACLRPNLYKEKEMSVTLGADILRNTRDLVNRTSHVIAHPLRQALEDFFVFPRSNKATQILLSMQYKEMLALHLPLPNFEDVEFRAYSQFGEDGILLYLFSVLGTTNKKCVEICGGGGYDNTANLIINHGWNGLFFEGSESNIQRGQQFYARCADTKVWPPKLVQAWITVENVNSLISEQGYTGEIDLLSLDMDGVDYWVWKAIECVSPRVVVLEYNNVLGPDAAVTIPYRVDFVAENNNVSPLYYQGRRVVNTFVGKQIADRVDNYYGASLAAFVKLGKQKGYRLVGCERYGFNAFFVRSGIGDELLPEIPPPTCFTHPYSQYAMTARRQRVVDREWVQV